MLDCSACRWHTSRYALPGHDIGCAGAAQEVNNAPIPRALPGSLRPCTGHRTIFELAHGCIVHDLVSCQCFVSTSPHFALPCAPAVAHGKRLFATFIGLHGERIFLASRCVTGHRSAALLLAKTSLVRAWTRFRALTPTSSSSCSESWAWRARLEVACCIITQEEGRKLDSYALQLGCIHQSSVNISTR